MGFHLGSVRGRPPVRESVAGAGFHADDGRKEAAVEERGLGGLGDLAAGSGVSIARADVDRLLFLGVPTGVCADKVASKRFANPVCAGAVASKRFANPVCAGAKGCANAAAQAVRGRRGLSKVFRPVLKRREKRGGFFRPGPHGKRAARPPGESVKTSTEEGEHFKHPVGKPAVFYPFFFFRTQTKVGKPAVFDPFLFFPNPDQRRKTLRFSSSGHLLSLLNTGLFPGEPMRKVLI